MKTYTNGRIRLCRLPIIAATALFLIFLLPAAGPRGAVWAEEASAPFIMQQPADAVYAENAAARFYVAASSPEGGYLTYQWYRSGPFTEKIDDPDGSGLTRIMSAGTAVDLPEGQGAILATKTDAPEEPGAHYYYYWAEITNHVAQDDGGGATETIETRIAEAKVVDRQLPDHITNGDFSTVYAPIGVTPMLWSNGGGDVKGWYTIAAQERMPDWKTTDLNLGHGMGNVKNFGDLRQSFQIFAVNGKTFGYKADGPSDMVAEPLAPVPISTRPVNGSPGTPDKHVSAKTGHGDKGGDTGNFGAIELSNTNPSSVYQEVATVPGKIYEWSIDHTARGYVSDADTMAVIIGTAINEESDHGSDKTLWENDGTDLHYPYGASANPDPAQSPTYFYKIVDALAKRVVGTSGTPESMKPYSGQDFVQEYNGHTYYVYIITTGKGWKNYAGTYTVPAGQGTTVFAFLGIYPNTATGNVIDNIVFSSGTDIEVSQEISYTGETEISTATKTGYAYALAEMRGSSAITLYDVTASYDPDGAGGTPADARRPTAGLGGDGQWYSGMGDGGIITFTGLTPGKTYRVIGLPAYAINKDLGTNIYPADVLDDGYYSDVKIMP
ncbi:MAG: hypothetical protein LBH39_07870, partial [Clostridiales Family XIII bacterium]|nr:hypothetical protein [Clostridiales Family XIII bacterium]